MQKKSLFGVVCLLILFMLSAAEAQESLRQKILSGEGLVGTCYSRSDFVYPEVGLIDILTTLDYEWGDDRGNDWSGRWTGLIEGPLTGEVTFIAEARDGVRLTIGNKVVIDGLEEDGTRRGKIHMVKGSKQPVKLEFYSTRGKALLRLYWMWAGNEKEIIPESAVTHSTDALPEEFKIFGSDEEEDEGVWVYPADEFPLGDVDLSQAKIVVLDSDSKILANAADMLRDEIEKRTRIGLEVITAMPGKDIPVLVIGVGREVTKNFSPPAGLKIPVQAEGFALWLDERSRDAATICIAGSDERGTLFAVGRLLCNLKMSRDRVGINRGIDISTVPRYSLRGHQFGYRPKTNSYDAWTIDQWEQYYRDMIVFGMNAIELIPPKSDDEPDSPHFPKPQLEMMIKMSQLAQDYGLDVWAWWPAIDGDYRDPKVVEDAIAEWAKVISKLPKLDVIFVPGGDPGDTHPAVLLEFMEKQKKNLKKYHPNAQMWLSPQGFDWKSHREGWMQAFIEIMQKQQPAWLDGIVFGPQIRMSLQELREKIPFQYPIRRYPDIAHCRSSQYAIEGWDEAFLNTLGREPINPRPRAYAKIFRDLQQYSFGFITYSEGCNDDFNKVLWSCLGWDPDMKVEEIAELYSRYLVSSRFEDSFARGLLSLEKNWEGPALTNENIYKTLEMFREMEDNALPQEKLNWRFQQGLYRAYYDAYIKARLEFERDLKKQTIEILKKAEQLGSLETLEKAKSILYRVETESVKPEWRRRVFELAEALFQSIRMQLSVEKYNAISVSRGANLDEIDKPLFTLFELENSLDYVKLFESEEDRLEAIKNILYQSCKDDDVY